MPVTDSPASAVQDHLPVTPSAQVRTRTREEETSGADWLARFAWVQRIAGTVLSGENLLHRQPPSVAMIWERHSASARHYNAGLIRGPRYLWAVVHTPFAITAYLLAWLTSSVPLLLVTVLTLFLIHQFA